jgi:hypothetical protein
VIRFEDALNKLRPNTEWVCYGGNLEGLTFMDKSITKPTQDEIDEAILELEAEADNAKAAAQAKLAALGLTVEDLTALGL